MKSSEVIADLKDVITILSIENYKPQSQHMKAIRKAIKLINKYKKKSKK